LGEASSASECFAKCPGCTGVEWWEGGKDCFECLKVDGIQNYDIEKDSSYPPHVLVKAPTEESTLTDKNGDGEITKEDLAPVVDRDGNGEASEAEVEVAADAAAAAVDVAEQNDETDAPKEAYKYKFGDISRFVVRNVAKGVIKVKESVAATVDDTLNRGKEARGEDNMTTYKFGDFTVGLANKVADGFEKIKNQGKVQRGVDPEAHYKFGDVFRGVRFHIRAGVIQHIEEKTSTSEF